MAEDQLRTVRLVVAYDGTDFHGFAESAEVPTVLGALRSKIELVVRRPVGLTGAGRTDAGVHAWGQVVSGALPATTDLGGLRHRLNRLLAPSISVRRADWAPPGFSARFSATSRTYRYRVWNDPSPNPLEARFCWHVGAALDVGAMNQAAAALLGEHDFTSFCRRPKVAVGQAEPSLIRRLLVACWHDREAPMLELEITATAFCHQMVRSIVGTLVEVGVGRRAVTSVAEALAAHDRSAAGRVAPPTGLVLWSVDYSGERWDA